jgi:hypothetical protein
MCCDGTIACGNADIRVHSLGWQTGKRCASVVKALAVVESHMHLFRFRFSVLYADHPPPKKHGI